VTRVLRVKTTISQKKNLAKMLALIAQSVVNCAGKEIIKLVRKKFSAEKWKTIVIYSGRNSDPSLGEYALGECLIL
jgi:DNA repair photolyase